MGCPCILFHMLSVGIVTGKTTFDKAYTPRQLHTHTLHPWRHRNPRHTYQTCTHTIIQTHFRTHTYTSYRHTHSQTRSYKHMSYTHRGHRYMQTHTQLRHAHKNTCTNTHFIEMYGYHMNIHSRHTWRPQMFTYIQRHTYMSCSAYMCVFVCM
jgi:hypothetical protein